MNNIKIKKSDLLTKIMRNRTQHVAKYEDAAVNYRKKVVGGLRKLLSLAQRPGDIVKMKTGLSLTRPDSHTEDYDAVIAMLRMSVDSVIELPEEDFKMYVLDQWRWKEQFTASASFYNSAKFKKY